ncbi:MAG: L-histidine N(alpha)-methyltransferase [Acidimicrobiales bacterium]
MTVDVHLGPDDLMGGMRRDALDGLGSRPRELPPTWFYDNVGCRLFDAITELDEYYPTRAERAILIAHGDEIAKASQADTFIELGSGTSDKTRHLLDAMLQLGQLERYVPFDVAEPTLRQAAEQLVNEYPGLAVHGVVGDFRHHLHLLPGGGRRMLAVLGGTIGNLPPEDRADMLAALSDQMAPGDTLLIGTDLVKDPGRLVLAYDDHAGVTAAFNRNVLVRLNRELGANFDLARFEHVAEFDEENEWIEMRLRSVGDQEVTVGDLGLTFDLLDGETIRTEISAKFRPEGWQAESEAAGLELVSQWFDPAGDFCLSLSAKPAGSGADVGRGR